MATSTLRQLELDCFFFGVCVSGLDLGGSRLTGAVVWVVFCGLDRALWAGAGAGWRGVGVWVVPCGLDKALWAGAGAGWGDVGVWVVSCGLDGALLAGPGSCLVVREV